MISSVAPSLDAAKKIKTQTKNYPLEMLSLTRSKAVLNEKNWVRAFLYAAIWSLEDCPGYTSLLVQSYQHNEWSSVKTPTILSRSVYDQCSTHTRGDIRSRHETRAWIRVRKIKKIMQTVRKITHTRQCSRVIVVLKKILQTHWWPALRCMWELWRISHTYFFLPLPQFKCLIRWEFQNI